MGLSGSDFGRAMLKFCEENGIPYKIMNIPVDSKLDAAVNAYVGKIEEGHRKAANSKLIFKYCV